MTLRNVNHHSRKNGKMHLFTLFPIFVISCQLAQVAELQLQSGNLGEANQARLRRKALTGQEVDIGPGKPGRAVECAQNPVAKIGRFLKVQRIIP